MLTDSFRLNCLIEGESIFRVFTVQVTVGRDRNVSDLKEEIAKKREQDTLKDVDPQTLELWKVSAIDESQMPIRTLTLPSGRSRLI